MKLQTFTPLCALLLTLSVLQPVQAQSLKPSTAGKGAIGESPVVNAGKLSTGLAGGNPGSPEIDGIVAIVNTDVITRGELNRQTALVEKQLGKRGMALPDRDTLRKQVLDRMINDKAQLQLANDTGIRIDDAQLEATMVRVAEANGQSLEQFVQRLKEDGVPVSRFREEIRNEIILGRLREREVESRIQVTEAEIQDYLAAKTQGGSAVRKPEVNWIQVLVRVPANAEGQALSAAQSKAAAVDKLLKGGANADSVYKAYPELKLDGTGNMGWQGYDSTPTLFTDFLTRSEPGAVTTIKSPNGFHVIKVLERREAGPQLDTKPVIQTRARHILIKTGPDVTEAEARRRLNFALTQLKSGDVSFETLARRYSQDGSASKGGDLGWLYQGDTVPEFEREMNLLGIGDVSPVFQSRFGFHVVQVVERRQQAASEERQRQAAKQAIRANKSDEAYAEWLKQLRDRTFVDIRL